MVIAHPLQARLVEQGGFDTIAILHGSRYFMLTELGTSLRNINVDTSVL